MAPTDSPRSGLTRRTLATGLALAPLVPASALAQGGGGGRHQGGEREAGREGAAGQAGARAVGGGHGRLLAGEVAKKIYTTTVEAATGNRNG
jgi:hypothetical protein